MGLETLDVLTRVWTESNFDLSRYWRECLDNIYNNVPCLFLLIGPCFQVGEIHLDFPSTLEKSRSLGRSMSSAFLFRPPVCLVSSAAPSLEFVSSGCSSSDIDTSLGSLVVTIETLGGRGVYSGGLSHGPPASPSGKGVSAAFANSGSILSGCSATSLIFLSQSILAALWLRLGLEDSSLVFFQGVGIGLFAFVCAGSELIMISAEPIWVIRRTAARVWCP